eukprot:7985589-Pyramimonas_sp.AAC.1
MRGMDGGIDAVPEGEKGPLQRAGGTVQRLMPGFVKNSGTAAMDSVFPPLTDYETAQARLGLSPNTPPVQAIQAYPAHTLAQLVVRSPQIDS